MGMTKCVQYIIENCWRQTRFLEDVWTFDSHIWHITFMTSKCKLLDAATILGDIAQGCEKATLPAKTTKNQENLLLSQINYIA